MRWVEHEPQLAFTAFVHKPFHCARVVGADDHCLRTRGRVVETQHGGLPHRAAVVTSQLVVVHVSRREAGRAQLAFEQPQSMAIDTACHEPVAVFGGVGAGRRQNRRRVAEQRQVVGVVAGHPTSALLKVIDQKAQVEDVGFVGKDVVLEATLEAEDVVERDRTCAND